MVENAASRRRIIPQVSHIIPTKVENTQARNHFKINNASLCACPTIPQGTHMRRYRGLQLTWVPESILSLRATFRFWSSFACLLSTRWRSDSCCCFVFVKCSFILSSVDLCFSLSAFKSSLCLFVAPSVAVLTAFS